MLARAPLRMTRTPLLRAMSLSLIIAALVAIAGCAAAKPKNATDYFQNAESMFRGGAYGIAIENYREMIDQYPFGEQTEEAELRIAHAHYLNDSYIEAIAAFTDFQRRHPTSPFLPFVGYELGMSYKQQMGTIDRDQSAARSADVYFSAVIAQYPDSPYAELAREEQIACRDSLAEHELYVARYYAQKGNFPALENRALEVVGRYPQSNSADQALYALGKLYEESDDRRRAALAYAALLQDHPFSARVPEAQTALQHLEISEADVGPAARQALLTAAGYSARRNESGATVEVPGVLKDDRPFAAPTTGIGYPPPAPAGSGGPSGARPAPRSGSGSFGPSGD